MDAIWNYVKEYRNAYLQASKNDAILNELYKKAGEAGDIHNAIINRTNNIVRLPNYALITFKNKYDAYREAVNTSERLNRCDDFNYVLIKPEYDMISIVHEKINNEYNMCITSEHGDHQLCLSKSIRHLQEYECTLEYKPKLPIRLH